MAKLLDTIKQGFLGIVTLPFWLVVLLLQAVFGILLFPYYLIKGTVVFFKGGSLFVTREDRAIVKLRQQDAEALAARRTEALNDGTTESD